jgi:disulfide bond formation protein DsbB
MTQWTKVVTHPLGLTGFALFLAFCLIARQKRRAKPWVVPVFLSMAFVALIGGLSVAYFQAKTQPIPTPASAKPNAAGPQIRIEQKTGGSQSPAVAGVKGDVSINATQTTDKKDGGKTPTKTKK